MQVYNCWCYNYYYIYYHFYYYHYYYHTTTIHCHFYSYSSFSTTTTAATDGRTYHTSQTYTNMHIMKVHSNPQTYTNLYASTCICLLISASTLPPVESLTVHGQSALCCCSYNGIHGCVEIYLDRTVMKR